MLLDLSYKVLIVNDGKNNNVSTTIDAKEKVHEVLTSMELAKKTIESMVEDFFRKKKEELGRAVTEEEFRELFSTITMKDLYDGRSMEKGD